MIDRRRMIVATAGSIVLAAAFPVTHALAQAPGRPLRLLVGFPPGGSADITARLIADRLRAAGYASSAIVENRPGGGGRTVLEQARVSDPDGGTVVLTPTAMLTIFPHVYRNLGYDTFRDFTAVGSAATFVTAVTAGPGLPIGVKTLPAFLDWAKLQPKGASYGSPGAGTSLHFVGTMLARLAAGNMTHVPYKGSAPMVQDLLGGQIPLGMVPIGDAVQHHRSGKLRVLATTGTQRSRFLPDVPTVKELGHPHIVAEDYFALFVPARTPPEVVDKLGAAIREALRASELQERLAQLGLDARSSTPAEMNDIVKAQFNAWAPVVKVSGFTADD